MRCGIMPTSCLLNSRWRQKVFSVGPREYVWLDVFLAAMLRGEWRQFERQLVEGLACLAAAADPRAAWPDDRQIEDAANTFRYERDLITSDETISWLDRAGLTIDAWTDYLVRRLLHDRLRDRFDGLPQRHAAPVTVAGRRLCCRRSLFGHVRSVRAGAGGPCCGQREP